MGRLIDCNDVYNAIQITTDNFGVLKGVVESNMLTMLSKIETVEAISKADIQKALKEGSKDISENVLAIVREEYISKADYENRLKADKVAMLERVRTDIAELSHYYPMGHDYQIAITRCLAVIDKHKAESEAEDRT